MPAVGWPDVSSTTNVRAEFYLSVIIIRGGCRLIVSPASSTSCGGQDQYESERHHQRANAGWAYYEGLHLAKPLYPSQATILTNPPAGWSFRSGNIRTAAAGFGATPSSVAWFYQGQPHLAALWRLCFSDREQQGLDAALRRRDHRAVQYIADAAGWELSGLIPGMATF